MLSQAVGQFVFEQAVDSCTDEQLLSHLHRILLDPSKFVASNLVTQIAAWQAFLVAPQDPMWF